MRDTSHNFIRIIIVVFKTTSQVNTLKNTVNAAKENPAIMSSLP